MRSVEEIMPAGGEGGEREGFAGGCPASGSQGRPGGGKNNRRTRRTRMRERTRRRGRTRRRERTRRTRKKRRKGPAYLAPGV